MASNDKELVARENTLPALAQFEEDSGAGFEHATSECYAIPYLSILQKMSPQCDKDDGKYVEGAEQGQLFNSVTQEVYGETVRLVPVEFRRCFTEWVPREQGGGFRGMHDPAEPIVTLAKPGPSGRLVTTDGTYLADTRYHFCLLICDDKITQVVIALASTQIKKSRMWLTQMKTIKLKNSAGKQFTPPSFSHVYVAQSISEQNEKGTWRGWKISLERPLDLTDPLDAEIYQAAKAFREQILAGKAKVSETDSAQIDESSEM